MSAKSLLKEARRALDSGECDRAIELCESVLREEPDHFIALLILGAAATAATDADHSRKALKALARATEVKPDQEAPWQGLLRLFRKYPESDKSLHLNALEKVIDFTVESKSRNLLNIEKSEITNDWNLLGECLNQAGNDSVHLQRSARAAVHMFQQNPSQADLKVLKKIVFSPSLEGDSRKTLFFGYFALIEPSELEGEFAAAKSLLAESFQDELSVHIFIKSNVAVITHQELMKLFEATVNTSREFVRAKAKLCAIGGDIPRLEATCKSLLSTDPEDFEVWRMLLTGLLGAGRFQEVETTSKAALKHCEANSVDIITFLGQSLYQQNRYTAALLLFNKAESLGAPRDNSKRFHCLIESGRAAEALQESLEVNDKMWALKSRMALAEELELTNAELNEVGMATAAAYLFYKKRFNDALKVASAALGQNPRDTEVLSLLGEIYLETGHPENALKCLQQSFVLNRNSSRSGKALSRTLRALKKNEQNRLLLKSITSDGTIHEGNCWAFTELGLHHLETDVPANAIVPFQKVATFKPSAFTWELLAEAYAARNSLAAAALCFKKCLDMGTTREAFILYRLACVTRDQDQFEEAIVLFEKSLQLDPKLVICAYHLGQCCLKLASIRLNEVFLGSASQLLSESLEKATMSICSGRSDLVCLWNLLGDVLLKAKLHNLTLRAPSDIKSRTLLGLSEGDVDISGMQLVSRAENSYLRCMSLNPNLAAVWHNLALVYVSKQELDRGISCLKRAIKLNGTSANLWNTLGVLSIRAKSSLPVCQSALIRALILDSDQAPSWSNLGFLYMKNNLLKEANQCFSRAQAADPRYVECWLGQASLAATVGHFDACDLYRHSNVIKPTTHAIICNLAMQGEATEELLSACERTLHCVKEHPACAAIGWVLLSHGLSAQTPRVLSECPSPECKLMFAQALLKQGNFEASSSILKSLPAQEKKMLEAYVALKTGRQNDAINLVPKLKDILERKESPQDMRKRLQKQLRQDPRREDDWRRLSECLLEEGKYETSLRVTNFIQSSYRREYLRVVVSAALMAGSNRKAYRAASNLVKSFPDEGEHWILLRWASLAMEKRAVDIKCDGLLPGFWSDFSVNVNKLDLTLRKGQSSALAPAGENRGTQICSKLLAQMCETKFDKGFLSKATALLKADRCSEAGLFLTGIWAIANSSEELFTRCLNGLAPTSSLRKLMEDQYISEKDRRPTEAVFD